MATAQIRVDLVAREIGQVADQLLTLCGGDDRLYADMIDGETDIAKVCSRLLEMVEIEEGNIASLTTQMALRKERRDAAEARIDAIKEGIRKIMGAAMLPTLKLPEATIWVRPVAAKLKIVDPDAVPEQFTVTTHKPSLTKINETYNPNGALPNWLSVEPARQTISIRRA